MFQIQDGLTVVSELPIHLVNLDSDVQYAEDPKFEILKPFLCKDDLGYLAKQLKCSTEDTEICNRKIPWILEYI